MFVVTDGLSPREIFLNEWSGITIIDELMVLLLTETGISCAVWGTIYNINADFVSRNPNSFLCKVV